MNTWNVGEYVRQTQANLIKQDDHRFITMQNIFRKLYLTNLNEHQALLHHTTHLNNHTLMAQTPARAIADYFHTQSKTYNEDFMRATFHHLAQAYRTSSSDNAGTLDTLEYKLFLSAEFGNLSEELKFGLRNNKVTFDNLVQIVEALISMEYVDFEIFNLLLLYVRLPSPRLKGK